MTLFVDTSALVAIVTGESDAADLIERLSTEAVRITSAVAVWEASLAVARSQRTSLDQASSDVATLRRVAHIDMVPIGPEEARLALDAHARFGKGRHPARLNMGDCFAYACARANGARLL